MKIQIDPHTLERAEERGTDDAEIRDVIETGFSIAARGKRYGKAKIYDYGESHGGRQYKQKRVEVIYVVEDDKIVKVTVFVFYGEWEDADASHL